MKIAIVYYSKHHGNTKKLLDAMSRGRDVTLIDASQGERADLSGYDLVGFASGIYYSKFHKSVLSCAEKDLPQGKRVFFVYTYGAEKKGYTDAIRAMVEKKNAHVEGEYGCLGFNTFGPFKLIGGLAKGHPNQGEVAGAAEFLDQLVGAQ